MSTKATGVTVVLVVIMPPVTGYHLGLGVLDSGQILSPLSLYSWSLYVLLCFNPPTDGLWGPAVRMMGSLCVRNLSGVGRMLSSLVKVWVCHSVTGAVALLPTLLQAFMAV